MPVPNTGENRTNYPDNGLWGVISDTAARLLRLDHTTHALENIPIEHEMIHDGRGFLFEEGFQLNNATREYLIETADSDHEPHLVISVTGAQNTRVEFIKRTDHTPGDEVKCRNRNERRTNTAETRIWRDPGGADGAEAEKYWSSQFGIAAAANGKSSSGGAVTGRHEIVLARRSGNNIGKYLLRVTALGQNDNNITVSFDWYEALPKN